MRSEGLQTLCKMARESIEAYYEPKIKPYRDAYEARLAKWKARSKLGKWWFVKPQMTSNEYFWLTCDRNEALKRLDTIHISTLFGDGFVHISCEDIEFVSKWAEKYRE